MNLEDLIHRIKTEPDGTATESAEDVGSPHEALAAIAESVAGTDIHVSISASDEEVAVTWRPKTAEEVAAG